MDPKSRAVVLFSGGLDSTTVLYYALNKNYEVFPLSFSYDQRHSIELEIAAKHCAELNLPHHVTKIDGNLFKGSALTNDIEVPKDRQDLTTENDIPITYVPVRNLIMLSIAGAYAESRDIANIFIGVNAIDYSGYPDCRPEFIQSFQNTLNLASKFGQNEEGFQIHTPLISLTKKEIVELGSDLNVPFDQTWSCYDPQISGNEIRPCQKCDSCLLREAGFHQAGIKDTLDHYSTK